MKKINEKLKTIAIVFCVIYTAVGLVSQTISFAWAYNGDIREIIEDVISSKITAYNDDFQRAVNRVVENNCRVNDDYISCY